MVQDEASVAAAARCLAGVSYDGGASILVFADDAADRAELEQAVEAAGARISVSLPLSHAVQRMAEHASPDGVIVQLRGCDDALATALFETMEEAARCERFRSIAIIPDTRIDLAATLAPHSDVALLCEGDDSQIRLAVARLLPRRPKALRDVSSDSSRKRLRELSEEMGRVARALAAISGDSRADCDVPLEEGLAIDAPLLRTIIRARRLRERHFGKDLFADPAWDMLLDLMAARIEGQAVAVSSLCIAAAVPPTTALRWIKAMTDVGLLMRVPDPEDRRRVFIELSPCAVEAMTGYLQTVGRFFRPFL